MLSDGADKPAALQASTGRQLSRAAALGDLLLSLSIVIASLPFASPSNSLFRQMHGLGAVLALAAYQFAAEGLVPLLLIAARRERLSSLGFTARGTLRSVFFATGCALIYDLGLSYHSREWLWVPLRRHTATRISIAASLPWEFIGLALTIATWGALEAFFGVFFAKRVNQIMGHSGHGWFAPGVLMFALFNGLLHLAIGQGAAGFVTSFASGYAIAVVPAVTGNAWGSTLFQALTNSVGRW